MCSSRRVTAMRRIRVSVVLAALLICVCASKENRSETSTASGVPSTASYRVTARRRARADGSEPLDRVPVAAGIAGAKNATVTGELGEPVSVRCRAYGDPPPAVYWYRGHGRAALRTLLLSNALHEVHGLELQILRLTIERLGEYECQAYNGAGTLARWPVTVRAYRPYGETTKSPYLVERKTVQGPVPMAAAIAGAEGATVTGELGLPLAVRCRAYGHPPPAVQWYRGRGASQVMIPNNDEQYEVHRLVLQIRRLTVDKLGEYECQANNGVGAAATWRVVVRAYIIQSPYLVDRTVTQPVHLPSTNSTNLPPTTLESDVVDTTTVEVDTDTEESRTTSEDIESTTTSEIPTTSEKGCHDTEFGCCFDGATAAAGPDLQGCPCHASEFGCRPDGVSSAVGEEFKGSVKSCNYSAFGCCPDDKTPSHGPEREGCCLLHPFGCCPDNYKPAEGPHFEGCGCQSSRFGCCPDNYTIATGTENKGCGCQYSEHGCCPDRHTDASGPNFGGCMCHTYQFGCCPDGFTVAQGPNGQGCYCQHSEFGCCGDEQTHAKGPNKLGCDCSTSKYGCCLDGVTETTGPKFGGCTEKPLDKQAACGLKFERGPCRNYSLSWFYDTEYGGCLQFWYGGCEGNGNRFSSKEECEDTCISPPAREVCRLPPIKGICDEYNQRWYYDTEREMCSNFIYGGCLGNDNNFETRSLCEARCEPERSTDQCSLTIERGSCAGNYLRWGYNKDAKTCEQFVWGGCEGNTNRFSSEAACMLRCNPPGRPQPECSKAQDAGNGADTEALWSYSQAENRCVPFYYTGSGGNDNRYTTQGECEQACPSAFVPELCTLPASKGDCFDYSEKWYFDTKWQRCNMFYYGGCGGNGNRFDSEPECVNRCIPPTSTPVPTVSTVATKTPSDSDAMISTTVDATMITDLEASESDFQATTV